MNRDRKIAVTSSIPLKKTKEETINIHPNDQSQIFDETLDCLLQYCIRCVIII